VSVQAGWIAIRCENVLLRRQAQVGLASDGYALQIFHRAELIGMKSSILEPLAVERNRFIGVAKKGAQSREPIAPEHPSRPDTFNEETGNARRRRSEIRKRSRDTFHLAVFHCGIAVNGGPFCRVRFEWRC
jgi:hypothetical protein